MVTSWTIVPYDLCSERNSHISYLELLRGVRCVSSLVTFLGPQPSSCGRFSQSNPEHEVQSKATIVELTHHGT